MLLIALLSGSALGESGSVRNNREKLDDDPTKVTTKLGIAWSDTYSLDDSNLSFSGSVALDAARKLNPLQFMKVPGS